MYVILCCDISLEKKLKKINYNNYIVVRLASTHCGSTYVCNTYYRNEYWPMHCVAHRKDIYIHVIYIYIYTMAWW